MRNTLLLVGICVIGAPGAASAQDAAVSKADKRAATYEKRAKQAYVKKQWDDAIAAFELAYETVPTPKYLFNIGKAMERKGDLFGAMEQMNRYIAAVKDEVDRDEAMVLRDVIAAKLRKSSGVLRLPTRPSGATARLQRKDQVIVATTPFERWLDSGEWGIEVALQDHQTHTDKLVIGLGETQEQILDLEPVQSELAMVVPPAPTAAPAPAGPTAPTPAEGPTPMAEPRPAVEPTPTPPPEPTPEPVPEPQPEAQPPPPPVVAEAMPPPPDLTPPPDSDSGGSLATWGWIVGAGGVAALGVAGWSISQVGTHLDERDLWMVDYRASTAPDDIALFRDNAGIKHDDAEQSLLLGQVLAGVGGALITTAIVLITTDGPTEATRAR